MFNHHEVVLNILSIQSGGVQWVAQMLCSARVLMTSCFKPNWGENYSAVKFLFLSAFSSRKFSGEKNKNSQYSGTAASFYWKRWIALSLLWFVRLNTVVNGCTSSSAPPSPRGNPLMQNVSPNSFLESWVLVSFQVPSVPPAGGEDSLSQSTPPFWLINKLYGAPWHS